MASTLQLKYNEIIVGGMGESKKKIDLKICEEGKELTYSCCKIFEKEEYFYRSILSFLTFMFINVDWEQAYT